jgi:hypothetical protein
MNLYTMVAGNGTSEAMALGVRLAAWHDAMVAHERKIRAGRPGEVCDEECPHADARMLWGEALRAFGDRAQELTFLRSRALAGADRPQRDKAAPGTSRAINRSRRPSGSSHAVDVSSGTRPMPGPARQGASASS